MKSAIVYAILICALILLPADVARCEGMLTFEAETGEMLGGASVGAMFGRAYVQGLTQEGDGVRVTVDAPEDGFYDLIVVNASIDGSHKENYVHVDGEMIGVVKAGRGFSESGLERVYLTRGAHAVDITKYWGWVRVDSVKLRPSAQLPDDLYNVEPILTDARASQNARRLMTYLCDVYGKYTLSGQYCDTGMYGLENACVWRVTGGTYPAILGLDLIEASPSRVQNGSVSRAAEYALEYWDKGGVVTLCWHWNTPSEYLTGTWYMGFYTEHTNINLKKIMDGKDPEGYALLMRDIDAIALELKKLADADVPVLWRPLHEASGGWFWWGASGAEAYIKLYRLLYDKLTHEYDLHNLIWVWNGQAADWYPGDEYVDIIGEDIYPGERVYTSQAAKFIEATRYTNARKMIVLSENGCLFDPDLAARDGALWGYFATWGGEFVQKTAGSNKWSEKYTEAAMAVRVFAHERVITRDELPDIKNYPLRGAQ